MENFLRSKNFYWVLAACFAMFFAVIPVIIGVVLIFLKINDDKAVSLQHTSIEDFNQTMNNKKKELDESIEQKQSVMNQMISGKQQEISKLDSEIQYLKSEIEKLHNEAVVTSYIFSDYDGITSEECKNKISMLKIKEQELIKSNKAFIIRVNNAAKKETANNLKQIIRCFNAECDNALLNLCTKNIDTIRSRITKSFESLNKIFETDGISINNDLLEIKLETLNLTYTYELKKEQEREEQKAIREQMLEEEKVRREIEREKIKIEKEEQQFKNEVSKLMTYMQKSSNDAEKELYINKIKELEDKLKLLEKDKENVLQREQNTRAGFVYIISNIGSFGDDVFKIGMTRRLEPLDRVKELGDASVPFSFDVHAMIFSEDAPTLESTLHQTFRKYEVNKINSRKEFFRVDLREIEKVVKEHHNATVTFTMIADAIEYRESLAILSSKELSDVS